MASPFFSSAVRRTVVQSRTAQRKFLPHQKAFFIAEVIEPLLLQECAAPHAQHVHANVLIHPYSIAIVFLPQIGEVWSDRSPVQGQPSFRKLGTSPLLWKSLLIGARSG